MVFKFFFISQKFSIQILLRTKAPAYVLIKFLVKNANAFTFSQVGVEMFCV